MDGKPLHYDGSLHNNQGTGDTKGQEPFVLTDEMRNNISGNPFTLEN